MGILSQRNAQDAAERTQIRQEAGYHQAAEFGRQAPVEFESHFRRQLRAGGERGQQLRVAGRQRAEFGEALVRNLRPAVAQQRQDHARVTAGGEVAAQHRRQHAPPGDHAQALEVVRRGGGHHVPVADIGAPLQHGAHDLGPRVADQPLDQQRRRIVHDGDALRQAGDLAGGHAGQQQQQRIGRQCPLLRQQARGGRHQFEKRDGGVARLFPRLAPGNGWQDVLCGSRRNQDRHRRLNGHCFLDRLWRGFRLARRCLPEGNDVVGRGRNGLAGLEPGSQLPEGVGRDGQHVAPRSPGRGRTVAAAAVARSIGMSLSSCLLSSNEPPEAYRIA